MFVTFPTLKKGGNHLFNLCSLPVQWIDFFFKFSNCNAVTWFSFVAPFLYNHLYLLFVDRRTVSALVEQHLSNWDTAFYKLILVVLRIEPPGDISLLQRALPLSSSSAAALHQDQIWRLTAQPKLTFTTADHRFCLTQNPFCQWSKWSKMATMCV